MNMYQPTLTRVKELAEEGNVIPIYRELPADLETPVSVYLKLQDDGPSFLLESVSGGEQVARYSFIGVRPRALLSAVGDAVSVGSNGHQRVLSLTGGTDPLAVLKAEIAPFTPVLLPDLPRFSGGAIGFLSYDAVRRFERLPGSATDELGLPEAAFMLADTLVAFDHARQRLLIIANARLEGDTPSAYRRATARIDEIVARLRAPVPQPPMSYRVGGSTARTAAGSARLTSNFSQAQFEASVRRAKEYIAGPCAGSTRRPIWFFCVSQVGWVHPRCTSSPPALKCTSGSKGVWLRCDPSPAPGRAALPPPRTLPWPTNCWLTRRSAPNT
jgi:anthranilate synthase component 1